MKRTIEASNEADIMDYINTMSGKIDYNQMVEDLMEEFGISEEEAQGYIDKANFDDGRRFDEGNSEKRELAIDSVEMDARGMPTKNGTKHRFMVKFSLDGDKEVKKAQVWAFTEDEAIQQLLDHYNAIRTDIPMFEEGKKGKKMSEVKLEIPHDRSPKGFSQGAVEVNGKFYAVDMQWFDEPSQWGIGNGRISRLLVTSDDEDGKWVIHYDRGWDVRPKDAETKAILKAILQEFDPDNELFMLNENTKITLTIGQLKKLMKG